MNGFFPAHLVEPTSQLSDEQIIEMFLATYHQSRYTLRNYRRAIEQFRSFVHYKPLKNVTWKDIEAYKMGLILGVCSIQRKKHLPATVASLIAPLRSLYKWGSDPNIGIFQHNPTSTLRTPKIAVTSKNHYLTKREVHLLLRELKRQGIRDYLIGLSLVLLGLRVSELLSIQWGHFHPDPSETCMWLTVVNGKGGRRREVKVPAVLWKYLEFYRHNLGVDESAASTDQPVFTISLRQVQRVIKQAAAGSNLNKKVTPHWLRHTNATLALLSGASLQQVQENLGHAHINTTQRYLHTVEQLQKAAPDYVEAYLGDLV
ncbi:tyrosine-type recombinase/integrase [Brevibacillus fulvus]|uniref:Integrase/recombinase XerD n=1 Tax=Brevibacillus fulvus TaxID=1125967 RepID=A0A939BTS4_9BACL|nr:tyrosine-type recombinase/integrase [Brevibacillus fulvus]MBM7589774.1 integrase/recombinase XerD [Brevibacillus fulvus]